MWTEELVRQALTDALWVQNATAGRVGPRLQLTSWPDMAIDWGDAVSRAGGEGKYQMRVPRVMPSAIEIKSAEIVLLGFRLNEQHFPAFLNGPVMAYPTQREKLVMSAMAKARKKSERSICRATGWNLSTFQSQRSFAARIIADWLNQVGLPCWVHAARKTRCTASGAGRARH